MVGATAAVLEEMPGDAAPADPTLPLCDREPIHAPGSIQPHGVLFALRGADLNVAAVSENVGSYLGVPAADLMDLPLRRVLDSAWHDAVTAAIAARADHPDPDHPDPDDPSPDAPCHSPYDAPAGTTAAPVRLAALPLAAGAAAWRATVHTTADGVLLEAELPATSGYEAAASLFDRFEGAAGHLQATHDLPSLYACLAAELRHLTGYDRVDIYRFAADWSGEVVGEDRDPAMPAYLGLHFPASDIPAQARALYARHPERQIPDVGYTPVPVLQRDPAPLDMGAVGLRSVSPVHVAYLRVMAVGASMSISILRHGVLWGLAACHHRTPRTAAPDLRRACLLLARLAAWQIGVVEAAEVVRRDRDVQAVATRLLREATAGCDYREAVLRHAAALLDLLGASGMALSSGGTLTTLGDTPDAAALRDLLAWLAAQAPQGLHTDHLGARCPSGAGLAEAAGLLAVPLGGLPGDFMLWFRPEQVRSVTWAGDPAKPIDEGQSPSPRRSFAAWREMVRGRAAPWATHEVAAAQALRDTVVDIIARRVMELERMNAQLARSNADLDAFAYVAAHDLKEPLRQIEMFGTLLERSFRRSATGPQPAPASAGPPADKAAFWFAGIQTSGRRLRALIDDLASYARLGQPASQPAPTDLRHLIDLVLLDFAAAIEAAAATVEIDALPTLLCDATQLRQVLQNLVSNALKYRHPGRPLRLRITGVLAEDGMSEIRVTDNGIGFDERHRQRIFEPFERLHSQDQFEGSGIGLAICRKVMARHDGSITARSCPGEGAEFTLRLPSRPPSPVPPPSLPLPGLR